MAWKCFLSVPYSVLFPGLNKCGEKLLALMTIHAKHKTEKTCYQKELYCPDNQH
jgi:hypothetical protein